MVKDGCLDGVDYVYGAHVASTSDLGTVLFCEGYTMSAFKGYQPYCSLF